MGALAWTMMGLALWHFTIFVPDRFWAGIVGAFLGSVIGAILFGLAINGLSVPGQHATHIGTVLEAVPGSILGVALVYFIGARAEDKRATGLAGLPAE
jgi:predicted membrane chloride channel (bestrophin family)